MVPARNDSPGPISVFRYLATRWKAIATSILWFGLASLLLAPDPTHVTPSTDFPVGQDLQSPGRIQVPDYDAVAVKRTQFASERVEIEERYDRIWKYDPEVKSAALEKLALSFDIIERRQPQTGNDVRAIRDEIYTKAQIRLSNEEIDYLYKAVNRRRFHDDLRSVAAHTLDTYFIVRDVGLYRAHRNDDVLKLEGLIAGTVLESSASAPLEWPLRARSHLVEIELRGRYYTDPRDRRLVELGANLLMEVLGPNLEFDAQATEELKERRLAGLDDRLAALTKFPPSKIYRKGDWIVRRDEVMSETQQAAVDQVYLEIQKYYPFRLTGVIALTFFCFGALSIYLARFRKDMVFTAPNVSMVVLPVIMALGIGRLLMLEDPGFELPTVLFPSAAVAMLSTIMMGPYAGLSLVVASAIMFGVATAQGFNFFVVALFGGATAVISLQALRDRKDVLKTGLLVGVVNAATVAFLSLFQIPPYPRQMELILAFVNGLACAAATFPLMVIFERAFGVVTDLRLLELTSPSHKLSRLMEEKAPGSYQHVLNVTKLAESAADAIGANYLLVRAGAYFHDIGKALKPKYFSENQVSLEDKKAHSKLSPYMSVLIIKNHVKEGIELGHKYGLPDKVIDFIPQHHGTGLIKYFYSEALQRYEETGTTDVVREEDFRYPGPKPQSVETGIVLLADSVEAIVTAKFTSSQVNENDLRRVVAQVVTERFDDGQFDECDLTMRDLFLIRESFLKTLKARFHHRIAYPTLPKREGTREAREGAATITPAAAAS